MRLTKTPATLLGVYDQVGSLDAGKCGQLPNYLWSGFQRENNHFQNWVQGKNIRLKMKLERHEGNL